MISNKTKQEIADALQAWETSIMEDKYSLNVTNADRAFYVAIVRRAVDRLMEIGSIIRSTYNGRLGKNWRMISSLQDHLLAEGQVLSNLLWTSNLRDKITDRIERSFGVGFSSLGIYREATDKRDGSMVYVMFYDPNFPKVTLGKDGEYLFIETTDFRTNYEIHK